MPKERFVKVCPKCGSTEVTFRASRGGVRDCCMNCGYGNLFGFPEVTPKQAKKFPAGERNFIPSRLPVETGHKPTLIEKILVGLFMAFLVFVIISTLLNSFKSI